MASTINLDASAAAGAVKMMDQLKSTLMFMAQSSAASTNQMSAAAAEFSKLNKTMNEMKRVVSTLVEMLFSFNATAARSSSSGVPGLSKLFSTFTEQSSKAFGILNGITASKMPLKDFLLGPLKEIGNVLNSPLKDMFLVPLQGASNLFKKSLQDMLTAPLKEGGNVKMPSQEGIMSPLKEVGRVFKMQFKDMFITPIAIAGSALQAPLKKMFVTPLIAAGNALQDPLNKMFIKPLAEVGNVLRAPLTNMFVTPFKDIKNAFKIPVDDSFLAPFRSIKTELLKLASELAAISLKGALSERTQKDLLIARTGSKEKGTAIFETVRNQAISAGIDPTEALKNTMTLLPMAANMEQYTKMTSMAMQLAAFDPHEGGTAKSGEAIKAAMNGDTTLLTRQYGISSEAAQGFDPQAYINNGDMDGFLAGLNQVFENANLGKAGLDIVYSSPQSQINTLVSNLKTSLADAGMGALDVLSPLIARIQEAFNSGQLQGFFDILGAGLSFAAELFVMLGDAALWVVTNIITYWPAIAAMLLTAAVFLLPTMIAGLYSMLLPLYMQVAGWLMLNLPILAVILVVGLLIAAVIAFGGTVADIVGFVVGIFYAMFAYINNIIALFWNAIVSFMEFIANLLIDPWYAIQNLVYNILKGLMEYFNTFINGFIDGINWIIEKVNSLTGKEYEIISKIDSDALEKFKPTSEEDVKDFSGKRMKNLDLGDSFKTGFDVGSNMTTSMTDKLGDFSTDLGGGFTQPKTAETPGGTDMPGGNNGAGAAAGMGAGMTPDIANVNKVDEVGKVNDTVDIASEDLKTMRELAEMKNIQNFVSLQPTVSVQTGDINNGTDIDTIINRIERSLNEQIASSAEGVYA
ncbi:hypothetical protein SAMN04487969_11030 [Paenibacillus algorifonticola]|uniref:Tape measure domain-containing protein n=1 Tax=Paenibacillus algorifonticola TaxID=684063 RepID=A0A1I2ETI2_9BACL|nr:hypothetical protein [Paenibacillus algorifonticola]SFE96135.1 hypothetical protein SAMN04487969_11030 [Paenibacillus algorifonticola]